MNYTGTIIEESFLDKSFIDEMKLLSQKIEPVTDNHRTPWVKQWTLDKVEILEDRADELAEKMSMALDNNHAHAWYVDYRNDNNHYVIFSNKIFKLDRTNKEQYDQVIEYGIELGIPDYQMKPLAKYLRN